MSMSECGCCRCSPSEFDMVVVDDATGVVAAGVASAGPATALAAVIVLGSII